GRVVVEPAGGQVLLVHLQEVGGAVEGEPRLHGAGDAGRAEVALQRGDAAGEDGHLGQPAAGGVSGDREAIGVDLVRGGVRAQPPDGRLDVVDLGREDRLGAGSDADAGDGEAQRVEDGRDLVGALLAFVAAPGRAGVPDQQRPGRAAGGGQVEVEQV